MSRPLALNTLRTARRLKGSATSVYSASVGMAMTRPLRMEAEARAIESGSGCSASISIRSVATGLSRPNCFGDFDRHLVSSERRAQLDTLHHAAHAPGHLAGDRDALGASLLGVIDFSHPLHEALGDWNAQLVDHELGIAVAGERPDPADHRDSELLNATEEALEQIEIEDGLGDGVLGAGLDLELEAVNLLVDVQSAGIGADAEQQRGLRAHRIAADVEPVVEIVHDVGQPDGVDVEDRGRVEVGSHARR